MKAMGLTSNIHLSLGCGIAIAHRSDGGRFHRGGGAGRTRSSKKWERTRAEKKEDYHRVGDRFCRGKEGSVGAKASFALLLVIAVSFLPGAKHSRRRKAGYFKPARLH